MLEIGGILVRQHFAALIERIVRVDAQRLSPRLAGFLDQTHLAVAGGQQNAGGVGVRIAKDAPLQDSDGLGIAAQLEKRLRLKMQIQVRVVRIKRHRAIQISERFFGTAGIVQDVGEFEVAARIVWIERNRPPDLA